MIRLLFENIIVTMTLLINSQSPSPPPKKSSLTINYVSGIVLNIRKLVKKKLSKTWPCPCGGFYTEWDILVIWMSKYNFPNDLCTKLYECIEEAEQAVGPK